MVAYFLPFESFQCHHNPGRNHHQEQLQVLNLLPRLPSASKSAKHPAGPAAGTAEERARRGTQGCIHPGAQGANLLLLHQLLLALFLFILELLLQQVAKPEVLRGRVEGSVLWVRNRHLNSSAIAELCLPWVASQNFITLLQSGACGGGFLSPCFEAMSDMAPSMLRPP